VCQTHTHTYTHRQTDRQTDRHTMTAYTALSKASRGKNHAIVIFHAYAATPPMGRLF